MTTKVVTTNSNTTPGNAAITGTFFANAYIVGNSTSNTTISAPNTEQKSSGVYYLNANGAWATSVLANNGIIANSSGTFVNANNGIIANSSGTFVNPNTGIVVNSGGVFVNSSYIGTLTSNNATNLGGVAAASYVQNTDSRTLSGNLVFSGANVIFTGSNVGISGTLTGNIAGNASTATKLLTARNINGVSFDGTNNITIADSTKLPTVGGTMTGQLNIQMAAPSIFMEDTNNSDFYIYVDGNIWNILNNGTSSVFSVTQAGAISAASSISGGNFSSSGSITAAGNITAFSDVSLKENVSTIDSALNKVSQMRGVYYNRIDDETKTRNIGVIAQEIEAVLPEVVHSNDDDIKSVAYGNIVGILIEAIKELNEEVKTLKSKLNV
jgi:hypothetical protein